MEVLELKPEYVRTLMKKAYEWRSKINKRNNRLDYFKTNHAINRFKKFMASSEKSFTPNKNEIILTITWFTRCPPLNSAQKLTFTLITLIYKLHKAKLSNLNK